MITTGSPKTQAFLVLWRLGVRHSDNVAGLVDLASPQVSATPASQQLLVLFRCRQTRPGGLGLGLDLYRRSLDLDSVGGLQPLGDPVDLPDYVIRDLIQLRSWLRHIQR